MMDNLKGYIKRLTSRQLWYVVVWSVCLFFATFYCEFDTQTGIGFAFNKMKDMCGMDLIKHYQFPLFIAMAIFLIDVAYELSSYGQRPSLMFYKCFIICFITFVFAITFSVLYNSLFCGWLFFILSWVALSVLKLVSLAEIEVCGTKIDDK